MKHLFPGFSGIEYFPPAFGCLAPRWLQLIEGRAGESHRRGRRRAQPTTGWDFQVNVGSQRRRVQGIHQRAECNAEFAFSGARLQIAYLDRG